MNAQDITKSHFVYRLYRRGSDTLVSAVSTWHETSDDMLRRTEDLYSQGFDVLVAHGGKTPCHDTMKWYTRH